MHPAVGLQLLGTASGGGQGAGDSRGMCRQGVGSGGLGLKH